jgi:hypothetical protein
MAVRQNIKKIDPARAGLSRETSMEYAGIYDHLTPKCQQLLVAAKKYKSDKTSVIVGQKIKQSISGKLKNNHDLGTLMNEQGRS